MTKLPMLISLMPVSIPRLEEAAVDGRALGLGLVVIIGTTVFFGLVPALVLLRGQMVSDLRTGERGSSRGGRRIYSVLVAGEVALVACALPAASTAPSSIASARPPRTAGNCCRPRRSRAGRSASRGCRRRPGRRTRRRCSTTASATVTSRPWARRWPPGAPSRPRTKWTAPAS